MPGPVGPLASGILGPGQTLFGKLTQTAGHGGLVLLGQVRQSAHAEALRVAAQEVQAHGVSGAEAEALHFLVLDALDAAVDLHRTGHKFFKTIPHTPPPLVSESEMLT